MLIRFGVQNHLSIRDYQEISMVASKLKGVESGLIDPREDAETYADAPPSQGARLRLVPILALYGANASGKSNLLHALSTFTRFIRNSQTKGDGDADTPYSPFILDETSRQEPARYDADIVLGDSRYHYGFVIERKKVLSEWLYSYPMAGARQARTVLFHRDHSHEEEFHFGKALRGENKQIARLVRANSLFLSAAAQNAHQQITPIYDFFLNKILRRDGGSDQALAENLKKYLHGNDQLSSSALNFLKAADIGVSGIDFTRVPIEGEERKVIEELQELFNRHFSTPLPESPNEREQVDLLHVGGNEKSYKIPLSLESAGTLSLLRLLGPALGILGSGGVLVVDELNTTLHPLVTIELLRLFADKATNVGRAQLLFTTHDTNILSANLLRRDQIWFAEKARDGATSVYSMAEIKVRSGENLETGYLAGRYGAIPYFGKCVFDEEPSSEEEE